MPRRKPIPSEPGNAHILNETICTLKEAQAALPVPRSFATVWKWTVYGVRGVKLGTYRVGRRGSFTSYEELNRFLAATQASEVGHE
jgi:hypothetical protein